MAADPNDAMAYTGRAAALSDLALFLVGPDALTRKMWQDTLAAADRAVALAPSLAIAHSIRAITLDRGFFAFAAADAEAVQAVALQPGNAAVELNFSLIQSPPPQPRCTVDRRNSAPTTLTGSERFGCDVLRSADL